MVKQVYTIEVGYRLRKPNHDGLFWVKQSDGSVIQTNGKPYMESVERRMYFNDEDKASAFVARMKRHKSAGEFKIRRDVFVVEERFVR